SQRILAVDISAAYRKLDGARPQREIAKPPLVLPIRSAARTEPTRVRRRVLWLIFTLAVIPNSRLPRRGARSAGASSQLPYPLNAVEGSAAFRSTAPRTRIACQRPMRRQAASQGRVLVLSRRALTEKQRSGCDEGQNVHKSFRNYHGFQSAGRDNDRTSLG